MIVSEPRSLLLVWNRERKILESLLCLGYVTARDASAFRSKLRISRQKVINEIIEPAFRSKLATK